LYSKVNNDLYWVAPLLHSGFFKWINQEGTAGYVMVSATNERDVKLVQNIEGSLLKLNISLRLIFNLI
jgi:nicotinamide riboside transporter PnuC